MKKLFLFALCMMAWVTCNAQEYFEGSLKARSFEKHGKTVIKYSKGMALNGGRDYEFHIKGKKMATEDKMTNVQTIFDADKGVISLVFHNIGKAVMMRHSHYFELYKGVITPTPTSTYKTLCGVNCRLYLSDTNEVRGLIGHTRREAYLCEDFPIDPALALFNNGFPYVCIKSVTKQDNVKGVFFDMNSYNAIEVHEVIPGGVDGALFEVPSSYEVVDGTNYSKALSVYKKMLSAYSENNKVLKKNKKGNEESAQEIKFDVDEEWDF